MKWGVTGELKGAFLGRNWPLVVRLDWSVSLIYNYSMEDEPLGFSISVLGEVVGMFCDIWRLKVWRVLEYIIIISN
jgi:hypothetical protein